MRPSVVLLVGIGLMYLLYTGRASAVLAAISGAGAPSDAAGQSPAAPPDTSKAQSHCPEGFTYAIELGRCIPNTASVQHVMSPAT